MKFWLVIPGLIVAVALAGEARSQTMEASLYGDGRGHSTVNLLGLMQVGERWTLFGFVDAHEIENKANFFLRSQVNFRLAKGFGVEVETDAGSGFGTRARPGVTFSHSIPRGSLTWKYFPVQTRLDGGKLMLVVHVQLAKGLRLDGFVDYYTIGRWVAEPECGYRLAANWFALLEVRFNGFQARRFSIAPGIRRSW